MKGHLHNIRKLLHATAALTAAEVISDVTVAIFEL